MDEVPCVRCGFIARESLCYGCIDGASMALLGRAQDAEASLAKALQELEETRSKAVWAWGNRQGGWTVQAPGGMFLCSNGWVKPQEGPNPKSFQSEGEALAAGRALPWWEVS